MTFYDAWIVEPGQPPVRVWFPQGRAAFSVILRGIETGRWPGGNAGHLRWEAQMTRPELEALLIELYGPIGEYEAKHAGPFEHHSVDQIRTLRGFVVALPEGKVVTVAVDEF